MASDDKEKHASPEATKLPNEMPLGEISHEVSLGEENMGGKLNIRRRKRKRRNNLENAMLLDVSSFIYICLYLQIFKWFHSVVFPL